MISPSRVYLGHNSNCALATDVSSGGSQALLERNRITHTASHDATTRNDPDFYPTMEYSPCTGWNTMLQLTLKWLPRPIHTCFWHTRAAGSFPKTLPPVSWAFLEPNQRRKVLLAVLTCHHEACMQACTEKAVKLHTLDTSTSSVPPCLVVYVARLRQEHFNHMWLR